MKNSFRIVHSGGLLFTFLCLACTNVKSQIVEKVTDINYNGSHGLNSSEITVFNGKLYFFGTDDEQYVDKLMVTADGSAAGVTVVKQIDSAIQYTSLRNMTVLNNLLIFDNHSQLWKSDGTTGGTSVIKNIATAGNYVVLNNKIYFAGDTTNSNPVKDQLWESDGTANGTKLVKTINSSGGAYIGTKYVYGGNIYFSAFDGGGSYGVPWVSDGTTAGTMKLKEISAQYGANASYFTAYNGKVYFSADDNASGTQLWVTDGTPAGTMKITNINAGPLGLYPSTFTPFNSKLFFMGIDTDASYQLWSTDGTTAGTAIVKADHTPRTYSGFFPSSMVVHDNKLYMSGYDSLTQTVQLWRSDGTSAGTTKVTNFPQSFSPSKLYSFQDKLIMTGNDTVTKAIELYYSDGTAAGTICPTPPSSGVDAFYPWQAWVPFNNSLYYRAAYGYFADYQLCRFVNNAVSVKEIQKKEFPEAFVLFQNYPNPFNPTTTISFTLPSRSFVTLKIFDLLGREVADIVAEEMSAGSYSKQWNAINASSGIYYYRIQAGSYSKTKKLILLK